MVQLSDITLKQPKANSNRGTGRTDFVVIQADEYRAAIT